MCLNKKGLNAKCLKHKIGLGLIVKGRGKIDI